VDVNQVEFKYIIINNHGNVMAWETGPKRVLDLRNAYKVVLDDIWENSSNSELRADSNRDSQFGTTTAEDYITYKQLSINEQFRSEGNLPNVHENLNYDLLPALKDFPKAQLEPEEEAVKGVPPSNNPAFVDNTAQPPHIPIARPQRAEDAIYLLQFK